MAIQKVANKEIRQDEFLYNMEKAGQKATFSTSSC